MTDSQVTDSRHNPGLLLVTGLRGLGQSHVAPNPQHKDNKPTVHIVFTPMPISIQYRLIHFFFNFQYNFLSSITDLVFKSGLLLIKLAMEK